ncbi:MAG: MazG nucleotide pyrophosphohydrolase domain-containing protein [Actinomycetes bacterium]
MTDSARPTVHVVGLGPAGADLVTVGTRDLIDATPVRFLRTRRHPAASLLDGAPTFDHHYESAERIEDVYVAVVADVCAAAHHHGEVLYAVPGSPVVAERTVELLREHGDVRVEVHPALSFADLTWVRLGVDPVAAGVRIVDAHRFDTEAAGERGPLLVCQCDTPFVLSDIKLAVEYPPDEPVVVLQRLGLPDEHIESVRWEDLDRTVDPDHLTSLYVPQLGAPVSGEVAQLVEVVRRLRADDPWKAEQTHQSLQPYLLEEAYEVLEALDAVDPSSGDGTDLLAEELGDLLYQVVLHAVLGAEAGWFDLADVATGVHDKLVARHPHIFDPMLADAPMPTLDELVANWESAKLAEKGRASILDGVPLGLPALALAAKVARKATVLAASPPVDSDLRDADLGAQLLDLVDTAAAAGLDPEGSLRRATQRRLEELRAGEASG